MSNAKKYIIAGVLVVAVVIFIVFANSKSTPVAANTPSGGTDTSTTTDNTAPSVTPTSTAGAGTPPVTTTEATGASGYKDGTYTGPVENAVYGNIQVAVTISGGKITDVEVPVAPSGPGHTDQVTASAIPALKQEALVAQSANVNVVSGATQDSQAFQQSLAAALSQAS